MKQFIFIFTIIFFVSLSFKSSLAQTQSEIEQLLNEDTRTKKEKKKESKQKANIQKNLDKINKKEQAISNAQEFGKIGKFGVNKLYRKAKKLVKNRKLYQAKDHLDLAFSKSKRKKQKLKVGLMAGDLNLELRDYQSAEKYFEVISTLNKNHKKNPLFEFQLANTYKYLAKYDTAIALYTKFLKLQSENENLSSVRRKARLEKKGAAFALQLPNDDLKFTTEKIGNNVNGPLADFGPELKGDKLFFSKIYENDVDEMTFSKIYYSEIYDEKFNVFQDFSDNINQSMINVGNASFSSDGNTVYFTECTLDEDFKSQCKILKSEKIEGVWQKPSLLNKNINVENFSATQPQITFSPSGVERLFFVSNKTRGKGGKDLWYSDVDEEGNFTKAKNLGSPFNTSYDDVSPFYVKESNTLYFSSNGHMNIGGFDVFKVENYFQEKEIDYEVKNLGYPINSSVDDYDFTLYNNGELGFLSSNRKTNSTLKNETCCDDIFVVKTTNVDLYIKGFVYADNSSTRLKYEKADVFLYDSNSKEKIKEISNDEAASFLTKIEKDKNYKLVAISDDFEDEEILFNTNDIKKSDTLQYDIFLKERNLKDFVIAKVYYQFDVSKLRADAPDTLRKVINFMEVYPDVIVEVASHTDSKGSEEYNLALSEKRSLAVKNYLIYQAKINPDRLINKWYGESTPAFPNTNEDGTDNPEGRDLNRRTEFKVIGTLDKKNEDE